ncbi:MAG: BTAD domain-containing putative transcriptional regulator [Cocleimonas sp.]
MDQQTVNQNDVLNLKMFGHFSVTIGNQEIAFDKLPGRKALNLLKLVALQTHHQLLKDQAIEQLWPNLSASSASTQLYKAIHHLRGAFNNNAGAIEHDWIALNKSVIELSAPDGVTSDIQYFESSAREGMNTLNLALLENAADTYSGELLSSDIYTDWTNAPREHYRKLYIDALLVLGKLYLHENNYSAASDTYQSVLELDNFIEIAHQKLMEIYVSQGDRNSALRQYQFCVRALQDAIDSEPSTDTVDLYQKIKSNQLNSAPIQTADTSSKNPSISTEEKITPSKLEKNRDTLPTTNLQHRRVSIIGREDELADLTNRLERSDLVTLVGPGGCGKTTIGAEVGRDWLSTHPKTNVWFCELAPATDEQVASVVYGSISGNAGGRSVEVDSILQHIGDSQTLLIFDNCEHIIETASELAEQLVQSTPNIKILATSREALDIQGEQLLFIEGLKHDQKHSAAVNLFYDRAHDIIDIPNDLNTRETVWQITNRLEGLPLAIELAVPRLVSSSPNELLEKLDDQLSILSSRRRHTSRQSAMDRTIEWSFDLLIESERLLLIDLGVFAGAFTLDAAKAVNLSLDVEHGLHRLVEQSMAIRVTGPDQTRYRLLEPIRQFVERLLVGDALISVNERHAYYFAERVNSFSERLYTDEEPILATNLTLEWADIGRALAWGRINQSPEIAIDPILSMGFHLLWQMRSEGFLWLEKAVLAITDLKERQADVDIFRSAGFFMAGDIPNTIEFVERSVAINGLQSGSALMRFYVAMVGSNFDVLTKTTEEAWAHNQQQETGQPWDLLISSIQLISCAMASPTDPKLVDLTSELERQMQIHPWPTGQCWGLLSHLTKSVRQNDVSAAEQYLGTLTRVAHKSQSSWFLTIARSLMASMLSKQEDSSGNLSGTLESFREAVKAKEIVHLPLLYRALVIALEETVYLEVALKVIGAKSNAPEVGDVQRELTASYEEAEDRLTQQLSAEETTLLINQGKQLSPDQVVDLVEGVCTPDNEKNSQNEN